MTGDTSMLKISFREHGSSSLDTRWNGQTFDEDYARLYCVMQGSAEIWHGGRYFEMQSGRLFLVPPASNMRYRCRNSCRIAWLHFNMFIQGHLDIFSSYPFMAVHSEGGCAPFKSMMLELLALIDRQDIPAKLRSQGILLELLSFFFMRESDERDPKETATMEKFKPVLEHIDRHCAERLTLDKLAKIANHERTYFSTLFKKTFSASPLQYIIRRRIEKAQALLSSSDAKLSSVAGECGFTDAFHLSKTFKQLTGKSPREFRRSLSKKTP